jgi:hypothetical protein
MKYLEYSGMTLKFINFIESKLLAYICSNKLLNDIGVNYIYSSAPQDNRYPFILLFFNKIINQSRHEHSIYELDILFHIFSDNKTQILEISEIIYTLLRKNLRMDPCEVVALHCREISHETAPDLISHKISLSYNMIISFDSKLLEEVA